MPHTDEELLLYLDHALPRGQRDALEKTLANDGALATRLAHLEASSTLVRQQDERDAEVDVVASWAAFEQKLSARSASAESFNASSAHTAPTATPNNTIAFPSALRNQRAKAIATVSVLFAAAAVLFLWLRPERETASTVATVAEPENAEASSPPTSGENDELAPATFEAPDEAVAARRVEVLELDSGDEKSDVFELFDDGEPSTVIWVSDHVPN